MKTGLYWAEKDDEKKLVWLTFGAMELLKVVGYKLTPYGYPADDERDEDDMFGIPFGDDE